MVGTDSQQPLRATEGERFGKYTIYGKIAAGGMAAVYLGRERLEGGRDRWVAIKRVHAHLATRRDVVQMFLNEARIVSRLEHDNICGIVDYGEEDESPYIVMRYLHGAALSGLLRRLVDAQRPLPVDLMAYIAACVCDGLHYAHEASAEDGSLLGLVHRDISPQNIFIQFDGKVSLLDFGVAKASGYSGFTRTGHIKGKYAYMSPEQVEASPLDRRSDVFSLGIVLWESLAGRHLFRRKRHIDTLRAIANADVSPIRIVNPGVPAALEAIVLKALQGDRRQRYQTAKAMGADLRAYLAKAEPKMGAGMVAVAMESMFPDRRHPSELQGVVTQPEIVALVTETEGRARVGRRDDPPEDETGDHDDDVVQLRAASIISDSGKSEVQPVTMPDALGAPAPLRLSDGPDTMKPDGEFDQRPLARADSELRNTLDSTRTDLEAEADHLIAAQTPMSVVPQDPNKTNEQMESIRSIEGMVSVESPKDDAGMEPTLNDSTGLLVAEAMRKAQEELAALGISKSLADPDPKEEEFEDATLQLPYMQAPKGDPKATIPDQRALPLPQIMDPVAFKSRATDTLPMRETQSSYQPREPSYHHVTPAKPETFSRTAWIMALVVLAAGLGAYAIVVRFVSGHQPQETAVEAKGEKPKASARAAAPAETAAKTATTGVAALTLPPRTRPPRPIELPDEAAGVKSPRAVTPAKRARARELEALARKSQTTGDVGRAEKLFIECIKLAALPTCHRSLGAIYAQGGDRDRAVAHYRRYLELAPEAVDAAHIRRLVEEP